MRLKWVLQVYIMVTFCSLFYNWQQCVNDNCQRLFSVVKSILRRKIAHIAQAIRIGKLSHCLSRDIHFLTTISIQCSSPIFFPVFVATIFFFIFAKSWIHLFSLSLTLCIHFSLHSHTYIFLVPIHKTRLNLKWMKKVDGKTEINLLYCYFSTLFILWIIKSHLF